MDASKQNGIKSYFNGNKQIILRNIIQLIIYVLTLIFVLGRFLGANTVEMNQLKTRVAQLESMQKDHEGFTKEVIQRLTRIETRQEEIYNQLRELKRSYRK